MDWDDLRFVLAIKRSGTLSDAATALGVTRTTVGRRLQEAEERLGVKLFDRTPEGLQATSAGEELAETALQLESEILAVESRVLGRDAALQGRLRVSTIDFIFEGFPELFATFLERYPSVELTVRVSTERVSLLRRAADVGLRLGNNPEEHLHGKRVGTLHFEAYAARSLLEKYGRGLPLERYPWIHWDERTENRWMDAWLAKNAPGANIAMRSMDYPVLRAAVRAGIGVHFMPCFEGDSDPTLERIGARLKDEARELWVLTTADLRSNSRVRAFIEHTRSFFEKKRPLLEGTSELSKAVPVST